MPSRISFFQTIVFFPLKRILHFSFSVSIILQMIRGCLCLHRMFPGDQCCEKYCFCSSVSLTVSYNTNTEDAVACNSPAGTSAHALCCVWNYLQQPHMLSSHVLSHTSQTLDRLLQEILSIQQKYVINNEIQLPHQQLLHAISNHNSVPLMFMLNGRKYLA